MQKMNRWLILAMFAITLWGIMLMFDVYNIYQFNQTVFFKIVLEGNYALLMIALDLFWIIFMGSIINNLYNKQKALKVEHGTNGD